jgi:poly(3-hydroxyalkanoate) synthetase
LPGGTLLGTTLACLAAKRREQVACATFFVSLLDFPQPVELGVFVEAARAGVARDPAWERISRCHVILKSMRRQSGTILSGSG